MTGGRKGGSVACTWAMPPQPSLFRSEYKLWIAAALFAVGMIFEERLDALLTPFVAKAVFFGIPYLLCGLSVLKKGLQSLLKFDFFNEYTLMGGATIAAAAIGQLPEAVGVMLFYSIGEALQDRAAGNSRRSIRATSMSVPCAATRRKAPATSAPSVAPWLPLSPRSTSFLRVR